MPNNFFHFSFYISRVTPCKGGGAWLGFLWRGLLSGRPEAGAGAERPAPGQGRRRDPGGGLRRVSQGGGGAGGCEGDAEDPLPGQLSTLADPSLEADSREGGFSQNLSKLVFKKFFFLLWNILRHPFYC